MKFSGEADNEVALAIQSGIADGDRRLLACRRASALTYAGSSAVQSR